MNIKSLLLGSAAALAVVSGAQAADAIVAAEPEPMEYVRVCDAFGTGFFYIPGTETCLKIGGEVRFAYDWTKADGEDFAGDFTTRARVNFTATSDSEVGVVSAYIQGLEALSR
jgi:opacity protein-like surface antigen